MGGGRLEFGIWKNFAQGETRRHALASVPRLCTPYKVFLHISLWMLVCALSLLVCLPWDVPFQRRYSPPREGPPTSSPPEHPSKFGLLYMIPLVDLGDFKAKSRKRAKISNSVYDEPHMRSTGQPKWVRRKFLIFGQPGLYALSRLGHWNCVGGRHVETWKAAPKYVPASLQLCATLSRRPQKELARQLRVYNGSI